MNWLELSDEEVMTIVDPIMDNLMEASSKIDHQQHIRDFSDNMRTIVSKDNFEQQCRDYQQSLGFFAERELLGIIKKRKDVRIFWRQFYTLSPDQYVAFVHIMYRDGRYQVVNASVS
ncbi:MAG: hypothetical protein HWD86_07295 [Kangiellaceae bacterium]|nr:hypothetical protein [Kangiellaceae bacterium]